MPRPRPEAAPDSLPRGWLEEELRARIVPAKITDPAEQKAAIARATSRIKTDVRIADIADLMRRRWADPGR